MDLVNESVLSRLVGRAKYNSDIVNESVLSRLVGRAKYNSDVIQSFIKGL